MTFIDLFSGIGGFRDGLQRSGHTCVGHVEIDKFANKSYLAMYELEYCKSDTNNENTSYLCYRKEKCCGENCNNQEWYGKDIKRISSEEIPQADI